jgi:methionyl aminopeptidase
MTIQLRNVLLSWTGKLRPFPQGPRRSLPVHISRPDYAHDPEGIPVSEQAVRGSAQIKSLTEEEEEGMRVACKVCRFLFSIFR